MKLNYFIAFCICCIAQSAIAQTKLFVKLKSSADSSDVVGASVQLLKASEVIESKTTGPMGGARFDAIAGNTYTVVASAGGYSSASTIVTIKEGMNAARIALVPNAKQSLDGVTVTEKKPVAKFSVDKKVYNVGQDITATGGSASDVLRNVPSLTVDPVDGDVAIRGNENILVQVDGKPSTLLGTDIATILQGIPASSIESVEVINNAGAQYDAQGKGGVLNIVLKKDRKPGYNGNVGINIGLPLRANLNVGFNANVKKWNFFGNIGGRLHRSNIMELSNRTNAFNDVVTNTDAFTARNPNNAFGNVGVDYNWNKQHKSTLSANVFGGYMSGDVTTNIDYSHGASTPFMAINRTNNYVGQPRNGTLSFNHTYTGKKKGVEWKTDASFGNSLYRRTSDFFTDTTDASMPAKPTVTQHIPVRGGNNNFTISTDYTMPLSDMMKLDFGAKVVSFLFHSENFPTYTIGNGAEQYDARLKNKYKFTQNTYAAYANYKARYKDYGLQAGLRFEQFNYDGFVTQFNKGFASTFRNFFPSIYLSKKMKKDAELTLSYTKRVNRPGFMQMVPYIDVTNPQDTSTGNPNLHPEMIHASELSYSYPINMRSNLLASVYYQFNSDLIQRYRRFNANGTSFTQPQNINDGTTYGAELTLKYGIGKAGDVTVNANVFNNILNGTNIDASVVNSGWSGFAKTIFNYKIKKVWDAQLTGNYHAPAIVAQGKTRAYGNLDAGVKYTLLKGSLTLSANANDIFNTIYQGTDYVVPNLYYQYSYRKPQSRQVSIGANWRFMSKNANPADMKDRKFGKRGGGKEENKDVKSRDENLKKDDERGGDDNNNGGNKEGGGQR